MVIWEAFQRTRGRVNQSSTAPTKNWSTARVLSAFSSPSSLHPTECTSELSSRPSSNIILAACSSSNSQSTLMLDASHTENLLQLCLSTAWACMHLIALFCYQAQDEYACMRICPFGDHNVLNGDARSQDEYPTLIQHAVMGLLKAGRKKITFSK